MSTTVATITDEKSAPSGPPAHSSGFRLRRFLNWFPLGLAYALLYMGRYNLTVAKGALGGLMTKAQFGEIFGTGAAVYGLAFLVNGPLTDRIGGRRTMLIALAGTTVANVALGLVVRSSGSTDAHTLYWLFFALFSLNMYFQSFGAVAIIKVNSSWFHVRERGGFSGIFGTMISSGVFLAYTVNQYIIDIAHGSRPVTASDARWAFFVPAALLGGIAVVEFFLLRDRPSDTGHADFDTGDARTIGDDEKFRVGDVLKKIFTNPIVLTIAGIEFCTGLLRQGVMQWYPQYTVEVLGLPATHALRNGLLHPPTLLLIFVISGAIVGTITFFTQRLRGGGKAAFTTIALAAMASPFILGGWGGLLFVAGVVGGNLAGWLSDHVFGSRRAPMAGFLYLALAGCTALMIVARGETTNRVAWAGKTSGLAAGDRILSIGGVATPDWATAQKIFRLYPSGCAKGAHVVAGTCVAGGDPDAAPAIPTVPAHLRRGDADLDVELPDPAQKDGAWILRAGDSRKLGAGPVPTVTPFFLGVLMVLMSMCVLGTHGVLSGTASMDFGGRRAAATATGMIDGAVYLGTALQGFALGHLVTMSWSWWPLFLLPFACVGFFLTTRIWHASPRS